MMKKDRQSASVPERRRFGRIQVSEPRICNIYLPQTRELWTEPGILLNISLGGIYLVCEREPPVAENDIRFVTLGRPNTDADKPHFGFHVLVVRTEHRQRDLSQFALALRILSDPVIYPLPGGSHREVAPLDKPRIMYQYYDLNKKAYEIITNMPEMRPDRISSLQGFIEQGAYQVTPEQVTPRLMNDLLMEKILLRRR
jgi:hypothetical protein